MEKKEVKKLHYLLIGYANSKTLEDSKRQWKEILEHINLELDKAREEGKREYARELLDDYYQPDSDSIEIDVSEIQSELSKLTTK